MSVLVLNDDIFGHQVGFLTATDFLQAGTVSREWCSHFLASKKSFAAWKKLYLTTFRQHYITIDEAKFAELARHEEDAWRRPGFFFTGMTIHRELVADWRRLFFRRRKALQGIQHRVTSSVHGHRPLMLCPILGCNKVLHTAKQRKKHLRAHVQLLQRQGRPAPSKKIKTMLVGVIHTIHGCLETLELQRTTLEKAKRRERTKKKNPRF